MLYAYLVMHHQAAFSAEQAAAGSVQLSACYYRVLATVPPREIEQAQQLLDEVKAIFAESEKTAKESERTDKEFQALQQLIPGT